jgi:hypothetical protein
MTHEASSQTAATPHAAAVRVECLPNGEFLVIHPLDDVAEKKCETENLGYAPMTPMVKWSLIALRTYLIIMALMVFYRCLQLARLID